jgi:TonB family protein
MFSLLIESRPVRRRSPAGFAASVVLHGILVAGAVITTSHATGPRTSRAPEVVLPVYAPVTTPPTVVPVPRPPAPISPPPVGPGIVNVPIEVPNGILPADPLRAMISTDQPIDFRIGTPTRAGTPEPAALPGAGVLLGDQVEVPVALNRRSPLPRFPLSLKNAGVEGMARLSFVVDTLGRVEIETAQVIESTHPAFAAAVQATLSRLRFSPARVGGHPVRQLVEFPVQFRIDK